MIDHRTQLFSLLGDLPPRTYPVTSQIVSSFQRDGVFGERLILDCNGISSRSLRYTCGPLVNLGRFPLFFTITRTEEITLREKNRC
jgi:hypothetical protein